MVYEARHAKGINWGLAVAVALLSILGFAAAGVIPTESTRVGGSYPLVGWAIVVACFAASFVFVRRAMDDTIHIRIDERGVWTPRTGPDPIAWGEIGGVYVIRAGIQRIARFKRNGGRDFGINTTFYDRGIDQLVAAVRHHRPDLAP
ncbi:MAG: hypothetical protein QOI38_2958 [Sphingomonadales bacterium]|jgi:hypothetical protein|nr:hypothetical protein [Sphingomonadales bacterium]